MAEYKIQKFPKSRIATIDVCAVGKKKHHVAGLFEIDITSSRHKIRQYNKENKDKISFTAWLIKIIATTVKKHNQVSSYRKGKNKLIIFDKINVSMAVEKKLNGQKVPVPLVIVQADEISIQAITEQIVSARKTNFTKDDIVLQRKTKRLERLYYLLPGFIRRYVWIYLLRHPKLAFKKMGNVAFTSIGMAGKINGWFIPITVHPICFGIGSVIKKPVVVNDKIEIREVLNMSVLADHDVIDGAPLARFISELTRNIKNGVNL